MQLNRHPERRREDRADLYALLDEVPWGTLATVADGQPWVVPMLFARDGDRLLLHGSTGAGALRHVTSGAPVVFSVTAVDGIVVASTTFDSSANYRSAVIHGVPEEIAGEEKRHALEVLADAIIPGRSAEVRASTKRELAATAATALPIEEGRWLMKARSGGAAQPAEEHEQWTGVVGVRTTYGPAVPSSDSVDRELPASVRRLVDRS